MIRVLLALADSPLVWFGVLLAALIVGGVLLQLLLLTAPGSMEDPPPSNATIHEDPRSVDYHRSNQHGR